MFILRECPSRKRREDSLHWKPQAQDVELISMFIEMKEANTISGTEGIVYFTIKGANGHDT